MYEYIGILLEAHPIIHISRIRINDLNCLSNKERDGGTSTLRGEWRGANKVWRGSRKKHYSLEGIGIAGRMI
jgi:hypothetical protein